MSKPTIVTCPTCGNEVEWTEEAKWRPFCSHRCRLIDLGEWMEGSNRIAGEETPSVHEDMGDYPEH